MTILLALFLWEDQLRLTSGDFMLMYLQIIFLIFSLDLITLIRVKTQSTQTTQSK